MAKKRKKSSRRRDVAPEASYVCQSCGEEIVVPIDTSAGHEQDYVEDCPVCCHPHLIHVEIDEDGDARAWAESESDLN
ncbi:MAG: CPXCG motif-containing cysteine-rich protein [Pirellulales bacterium]